MKQYKPHIPHLVVLISSVGSSICEFTIKELECIITVGVS